MEQEFSGKFSTGLCDCCAEEDGLKTCCLTAWVPCAQYGLNVERLEPETGAWFAGDFIRACGLHFGSQVVGQLVVAGAAQLCGISLILPLWLFPQLNARQAIRRKYRIKGNSLGDLCTVVWCATCALCQEHRQLKLPVPSDSHVAEGVPVESSSAPLMKGEYMQVPIVDYMPPTAK